jgi:hypothetical protein
MNILTAESRHIEYISNALTEYFSRINTHFGFHKFKDDLEIMQKHVSKRIEQDLQEFKYFVAEDEEGKNLGFISLMIDEEDIGNILVVYGEKEVIKPLLTTSIDYFRGLGINIIQGEVATFNEETVKILQSIGMKEKLINYCLDN